LSEAVSEKSSVDNELRELKSQLQQQTEQADKHSRQLHNEIVVLQRQQVAPIAAF